MIPSNELLVAYNYDSWYGYNQKEPIQKDVTVKNNSHNKYSGCLFFISNLDIVSNCLNDTSLLLIFCSGAIICGITPLLLYKTYPNISISKFV